MMGLTHAIGGATSVLAVNYINPKYFPLSIWLIILSFYVSQGPDIDMHHSRISKNVYLKPFLFLLSPFISGHRAKETHSIFGTILYGLISAPLIFLAGWGFWLALVLAYFSHIFLDYFNPTGVPIWYFPILNKEPRNWSLYNTIPLLVLEVPFGIKYIYSKTLHKIFSKKNLNIERKKIKFDGVGVGTSGSLETFISMSLWIGFISLFILQIKELKLVILEDSKFLNIVFPLTILIIINLVYQNKDIIHKNFRYFKLFFIGGVFVTILAYFTNILKFGDLITKSNSFILVIGLLTFSLIPLIYYLLIKFYKNIKSLPKDLFKGKKAGKGKDISDFTILTHILLISLVIVSFYNIKDYNKNYNAFVTYYKTVEDKKELLSVGLEKIKEAYKESINEIRSEAEKEINKLDLKQN